jgi:nucleoside diphosphate kinase
LARSPFDVPGIATNVSAEEIVDIVREMRERVNAPLPKKSTRGAIRKRLNTSLR